LLRDLDGNVFGFRLAAFRTFAVAVSALAAAPSASRLSSLTSATASRALTARALMSGCDRPLRLGRPLVDLRFDHHAFHAPEESAFLQENVVGQLESFDAKRLRCVVQRFFEIFSFESLRQGQSSC